MLIEKIGLDAAALAGKTVILTGGGGGIGWETARALVWLGANVVIAEVDAQKGKAAEQAINRELGGSRAEFYETDLSEEAQLDALVKHTSEKYGFVDVVFNNATITPLGAVEDVPAAQWDKSYTVNLRAPLLLAQKLLPAMKQRNSGTIIFVSSSGAAPYMGAYEVFKTAQVELCNTLAGELEGTDISTLTIGPGLVRTDTAMKGIDKIAELMGMSADAFYKMNEAHMISSEEAGTGFALAVVYAKKYNGQEVSSIQLLHEMDADAAPASAEDASATQDAGCELAGLISQAAATYREQYEGWLSRSVFERQWVLRDFKKSTGFSAEQFKSLIETVLGLAQSGSFSEIRPYKAQFQKLRQYYEHQYKLLQGFEKNPEKLKTNSAIILGWVETIQKVSELL